MSALHEKETLNGLVNQLNLPYTIVSTTDEQRELRRRLAFVRRLQLALHPTLTQPTKITVAKAYLAAYRLHDDMGKLLGYLGGQFEDIGDYAHDLRQLAPVAAQAAEAQTQLARELKSQVSMGEGYTDEERSYLGKVLKETIKTVKCYAVSAPMTSPTEGSPKIFGEGYWPDVADTWAAASTWDTGTETYGAALLPGALAARVRDRTDEAVLVNVTQLNERDRLHVATKLSRELDRDNSDVRTAIIRSFV